ncbi:hypothetical protein B0H34DRAFT_672281 [Crassisporium funariophilum]|nr:hypothetical protein B0H34DRAFT_672281 [Crassisporium funariophilum]
MKSFLSRLNDSHTGHTKSASKESYKFWIPSNTDSERNPPNPNVAHPDVAATLPTSRPQREKRSSSRTPKPFLAAKTEPPAPPVASTSARPPNDATRHTTIRPNLGSSSTQYHQINPSPIKAHTIKPRDYSDAKHRLPSTTATGPTALREDHVKSSRYGQPKLDFASPFPHELWLPPPTAPSTRYVEEQAKERGRTQETTETLDRQRQRNEERERAKELERRDRDRDRRERDKAWVKEQERKEKERGREWELEKERDRDRDRERTRMKEREQEREREREKEREIAREREREIAREKKEREIAREREREAAKDRDREMARERERKIAKERERDMARERERELAREKEQIAKERTREIMREKERELAREKEREIARVKEQEIVAREKEREIVAREKERELAKERERELAREKEREMVARERERELVREKEREMVVRERERELAREKEREMVARERERELVREKEREIVARERERELAREKEREIVARERERELAREKEREMVARERERELAREKEQEMVARERERELAREKEREMVARERERELAREKEREMVARERERELAREKEREIVARERERELAREKEREIVAREKERERENEVSKEKEREAAREREKKNRETARERERERERETAKEREKERERERERVKEVEKHIEKERRDREHERERNRYRPLDREREVGGENDKAKDSVKESPNAKARDRAREVDVPDDKETPRPEERSRPRPRDQLVNDGGGREDRMYNRDSRRERERRTGKDYEATRVREKAHTKHRAEATDGEQDVDGRTDRARRQELNHGLVSDVYADHNRKVLLKMSDPNLPNKLVVDEGDSSDNSMQHKSLHPRTLHRRHRTEEGGLPAKVIRSRQDPSAEFSIANNPQTVNLAPTLTGAPPATLDGQPPLTSTPHHMPVYLPPKDGNIVDRTKPQNVSGAISDSEALPRREITRLKFVSRQEEPSSHQFENQPTMTEPAPMPPRRPPSRAFGPTYTAAPSFAANNQPMKNAHESIYVQRASGTNPRSAQNAFTGAAENLHAPTANATIQTPGESMNPRIRPEEQEQSRKVERSSEAQTTKLESHLMPVAFLGTQNRTPPQPVANMPSQRLPDRSLHTSQQAVSGNTVTPTSNIESGHRKASHIPISQPPFGTPAAGTTSDSKNTQSDRNHRDAMPNNLPRESHLRVATADKANDEETAPKAVLHRFPNPMVEHLLEGGLLDTGRHDSAMPAFAQPVERQSDFEAQMRKTDNRPFVNPVSLPSQPPKQSHQSSEAHMYTGLSIQRPSTVTGYRDTAGGNLTNRRLIPSSSIPTTSADHISKTFSSVLDPPGRMKTVASLVPIPPVPIRELTETTLRSYPHPDSIAVAPGLNTESHSRAYSQTRIQAADLQEMSINRPSTTTGIRQAQSSRYQVNAISDATLLHPALLRSSAATQHKFSASDRSENQNNHGASIVRPATAAAVREGNPTHFLHQYLGVASHKIKPLTEVPVGITRNAAGHRRDQSTASSQPTTALDVRPEGLQFLSHNSMASPPNAGQTAQATSNLRSLEQDSSRNVNHSHVTLSSNLLLSTENHTLRPSATPESKQASPLFMNADLDNQKLGQTSTSAWKQNSSGLPPKTRDDSPILNVLSTRSPEAPLPPLAAVHPEQVSPTISTSVRSNHFISLAPSLSNLEASKVSPGNSVSQNQLQQQPASMGIKQEAIRPLPYSTHNTSVPQFPIVHLPNDIAGVNMLGKSKDNDLPPSSTSIVHLVQHNHFQQPPSPPACNTNSAPHIQVPQASSSECTPNDPGKPPTGRQIPRNTSNPNSVPQIQISHLPASTSIVNESVKPHTDRPVLPTTFSSNSVPQLKIRYLPSLQSARNEYEAVRPMAQGPLIGNLNRQFEDANLVPKDLGKGDTMTPSGQGSRVAFSRTAQERPPGVRSDNDHPTTLSKSGGIEDGQSSVPVQSQHQAPIRLDPDTKRHAHVPEILENYQPTSKYVTPEVPSLGFFNSALRDVLSPSVNGNPAHQDAPPCAAERQTPISIGSQSGLAIGKTVLSKDESGGPVLGLKEINNQVNLRQGRTEASHEDHIFPGEAPSIERHINRRDLNHGRHVDVVQTSKTHNTQSQVLDNSTGFNHTLKSPLSPSHPRIQHPILAEILSSPPPSKASATVHMGEPSLSGMFSSSHSRPAASSTFVSNLDSSRKLHDSPSQVQRMEEVTAPKLSPSQRKTSELLYKNPGDSPRGHLQQTRIQTPPSRQVDFQSIPASTQGREPHIPSDPPSDFPYAFSKVPPLSLHPPTAKPPSPYSIAAFQKIADSPPSRSAGVHTIPQSATFAPDRKLSIQAPVNRKLSHEKEVGLQKPTTPLFTGTEASHAQTTAPSNRPTSVLHSTSRHRHSTSLPTSFPPPVGVTLPMNEGLPRSATPSHSQFISSSQATASQVHQPSQLTSALPRAPSEETILMTPSSLAHSVMLKPTASRQSVTPSVSSQIVRKGGGIFSMFRSKTPAQPPPQQYAVWHPPNSSHTLDPGMKDAKSLNTTSDAKALTSTPPKVKVTPPAPISRSVPIAPISRSVPIANERRSPKPKVFTPFRYLTTRRNRAVSVVSMEAQDGTAPNTVVGSPTASMHSQVPLQPPPMRDPMAATEEWRNKEEADVHARTRIRKRRQRPGVVFDVAEETPEDSRQRPKRTRTRYRSTSKQAEPSR